MIVETDPHAWHFGTHAIERARERLGEGCTVGMIVRLVREAPDDSWAHVSGCLNTQDDKAVMVTTYIPGVAFVIGWFSPARHRVISVVPWSRKRRKPKRAPRVKRTAWVGRSGAWWKYRRDGDE